MMTDTSGEVLTNDGDKSMEATKPFGNIEGAKFMTDIEIVERYNATDDVAPRSMRRSIHNFASLYELEDTLASTKTGRAPGPDDIPIELIQWLNDANLDKIREIINRWWNSGKLPEQFCS